MTTAAFIGRGKVYAQRKDPSDLMLDPSDLMLDPNGLSTNEGKNRPEGRCEA